MRRKQGCAGATRAAKTTIERRAYGCDDFMDLDRKGGAASGNAASCCTAAECFEATASQRFVDDY
jgi:hypothetical protein